MSISIIVAYFAVLGVLGALGLQRLFSVAAAFRYRSPPKAPIEDWPQVLVQLPLYNEVYVAERSMRALAALRAPSSRLLIQVLDDSDDGTRSVVDRVARELKEKDVPIEVVRRANRSGFKAGALAHGLAAAPEAEAVAIFDADFTPPPDFLEKTLPVLLSQPDVGLVQTRWGHLNRDASLLTRAQGVFLDGHFAVEHAARHALGHPFNFNGTAGLWRRRAIDGAGGWQGDTITEDLDLSYRAQLVGWRFLYVHEAVAPAELPESWSAFRAQQGRWVRGSVQTSRKLLTRVLTSRCLSRGARASAALHLTNNFAYLLMAGLAVLLPVTLILREELGWRVPGGRVLLSGLDLVTLGVGTLAVVVFYLVALHRTAASSLTRLGDVVFALCVGAGMSLSNGLEVFRGLTRDPAEFVRTPKKGGGRSPGAYRSRWAGRRSLVELVFAAYHGVGVIYAVTWEVWGALPFLMLYLVGFGTVGARTALEGLGRARRSAGFDVKAFETRQG